MTGGESAPFYAAKNQDFYVENSFLVYFKDIAMTATETPFLIFLECIPSCKKQGDYVVCWGMGRCGMGGWGGGESGLTLRVTPSTPARCILPTQDPVTMSPALASLAQN